MPLKRTISQVDDGSKGFSPVASEPKRQCVGKESGHDALLGDGEAAKHEGRNPSSRGDLLYLTYSKEAATQLDSAFNEGEKDITMGGGYPEDGAGGKTL
jgi:hypothetical protein